MNSGEDNIKLLVASDELLLEELFNHVQDYLIENKPNWIQQNFSFVLQTVFKLSDCKTLHDYCLESICAHPLPFFSSNNFLTLDMNIIYELLKRDDLQIEEIVAWDYLIKWGIEQTPGLKNKVNRKEWSDKDYEDLKNTLNEIIPLIRFSCINSSDFFDKIRPYRPIIPNNIYEEIVSFYFKDSIPKSIALSPRIGIYHIKSMVIKSNLSTIILNWIERQYHQTTTRDKNDQKYKFDLLYRGSRDGINSGILKDKCYRQFPCLVLISVHSSPKIFGGYSPIGVYFCNGGKWHYTPDSFIFTFENRGDTEKMKMSRVTYPNYALYEFYDCAFNFGGGCLAMDNDKNLHVKNSGYYQNNFNINASYVIKEVEVFRVVKQ
ncbi:hypothetical protein C1645_512166 [Glomus cerebriforme]|uniref:TLDc domain-containing protein n=1 Tax=Glomus cerebriforme TaxID=658196 RepID=A0A397TFF3_9GLOM|nr:hypothetical protein C1645_512166 [Glomus cerebriforme]